MGKRRSIDMSDILIYLDYVYKGDFDKTYEHIKNKKPLNLVKVQEVSSMVRIRKDVTTIFDKDYPEKFKKVSKPPFVIKKRKKRRMVR